MKFIRIFHINLRSETNYWKVTHGSQLHYFSTFSGYSGSPEWLKSEWTLGFVRDWWHKRFVPQVSAHYGYGTSGELSTGNCVTVTRITATWCVLNLRIWINSHKQNRRNQKPSILVGRGLEFTSVPYSHLWMYRLECLCWLKIILKKRYTDVFLTGVTLTHTPRLRICPFIFFISFIICHLIYWQP